MLQRFQTPIHYITAAVAAITLAFGVYALISSTTSNNVGFTFVGTGLIALAVTGLIVFRDYRYRANLQSIIDHGNLTGPYRSLHGRVSSQQMNNWISASPAQRTRSLQISYQSMGNTTWVPPHHPIVLRHAINDYNIQDM